MLVLPLGPTGRPFGVLQILDRLDGQPFRTGDLDRGAAVAELALTALDMHDRADTASGRLTQPDVKVIVVVVEPLHDARPAS